ncbi:MAG: hypothetical protein ACMV1B_00035 [Prevotella sp.]
MATRPTNDLLVWANTDVNLPNLAGPNKTQPSADLVAKGWDFKQKPSADEFNYILNNLGEHIAYLEGDLTYTFTGDVTGTVNTSGSEDATINLQVVDNSHNHTSANISDATSLNNANMVMRRDNNGDVAARYFVGDLVGNAATATKWQTARTLTLTGSVTGSVSVDGSGNVSMATSVSSSSGVAILTGIIANGGTIPLPSGFSESQCKWVVSMRADNPASIPWDINESDNQLHYKTECYTIGRVVTARTYLGSNNSPPGWIDSDANYIIIGVK